MHVAVGFERSSTSGIIVLVVVGPGGGFVHICGYFVYGGLVCHRYAANIDGRARSICLGDTKLNIYSHYSHYLHYSLLPLAGVLVIAVLVGGPQHFLPWRVPRPLVRRHRDRRVAVMGRAGPRHIVRVPVVVLLVWLALLLPSILHVPVKQDLVGSGQRVLGVVQI